MTSKSNLQEPVFNSLNWNVPLNANFNVVDNCFGTSSNFIVSNADITATATQCQSMGFGFLGTLTQNISFILPAGISGTWFINNSTGGAFSIYVKTATLANSIFLPKGTTTFYSDGNVVISLSSDGTPAGVISAFGGTTPPTGWIACVGISLPTVGIYSNLFAAIGYTWGGSGASFNLPDLRGAFIRGFDAGRGFDPGRIYASYQADTYLNHTHTATSTDSGHTHTYASPGLGTGIGGGTNLQNVNYSTTPGFANITTTVATSTTGGTETVPKNYAMYYIIKY
jgi:microcystin-dependent protein